MRIIFSEGKTNGFFLFLLDLVNILWNFFFCHYKNVIMRILNHNSVIWDIFWRHIIFKIGPYSLIFGIVIQIYKVCVNKHIIYLLIIIIIEVRDYRSNLIFQISSFFLFLFIWIESIFRVRRESFEIKLIFFCIPRWKNRLSITMINYY